MLRFRRMRSLQKLAAVHSSIHTHFNKAGGLSRKDNFKAKRTATLAAWHQHDEARSRAGLGKQGLVRIRLTPPATAFTGINARSGAGLERGWCRSTMFAPAVSTSRSLDGKLTP